MKSSLFTRFLAGALMTGVSLAVIAPDAEAARRLGGGKSVGKQSDNVTKQAPPATPSKAAAAQPAATPAAAAAPQPARNKWLGPLAGLAAGLGIAALLSHLGMGGALAQAMMTFLMIGLLVAAAFFIYRMIKNRNAPNLAPAGGSPNGNSPFAAREALQPSAAPTPQPFVGGVPAIGSGIAPAIGSGIAPAAGGGTWTVPAGFEVDDFLHIAKMYFVRMQAAWDAGDEKDIRNFTTPEMFAEIKLDLNTRTENTRTDVVKVDAEFLGVEEHGETTLASVRLSGLIRESADGAAEAFSEVWNLEKPATARASWVLAGIQQEDRPA